MRVRLRAVVAAWLALCVPAISAVPLLAAVLTESQPGHSCCRTKGHGCCQRRNHSGSGPSFSAAAPCGDRCLPATAAGGTGKLTVPARALARVANGRGVQRPLCRIPMRAGVDRRGSRYERPPPALL